MIYLHHSLCNLFLFKISAQSHCWAFEDDVLFFSAFKFFSLSLILRNFIITCLGIFFLQFILLGDNRDSSISLKIFLAIIASDITSGLVSLLCSQKHNFTYMLDTFTMSYLTLQLFSVFPIVFYPLCFSLEILLMIYFTVRYCSLLDV